MTNFPNVVSNQHVLILTEEGDVHADYVIRELNSIGCNYTRLHTRDWILGVEYSIETKNDKFTAEIRVLASDRTFFLHDITAVYYRRPEQPVIDSISDPGARTFAETEAQAVINGLYGIIDQAAIWINVPNHNRFASHKLTQLHRAAMLGLTIPPTLATNLPTRAEKFFINNEKNLICKALKQELVHVNGESRFIFTHDVPRDTTKRDFEDIKLGSSLLQMRINKRSDIRVVLVGDRYFACEIESQDEPAARTDWRVCDPYVLKHTLIDLPASLENQLQNLRQSFGLTSCQIDLVRSDTGNLVFLELNPNGQWLWIEIMTGAQISRALAETLTRPVGA